MIDKFDGQYFWLSNFHVWRPIEMDGECYPTVEHAYQAAKTLDKAERIKIRDCFTPGQAKRMGRKVSLRKDWGQVKFGVMLNLLRQKFSHADTKKLLLGTGTEELIEGNTWGDTFWGCVWQDGQWVGQNHLGKLLMQVREEI